MKIAIDGPGSAGKSTVAKMLAACLGVVYIDSGAMYRGVAYYIIRQGKNPGDVPAVIGALSQIAVDISHDGVTGEQSVFLNGEDVTAKIRTPDISKGASEVSRIPEVRLRLVELQRKLATGRSVVMDGRDIGTYVFPDADRKYYLTAPAGIRAQRRYLEMRPKGGRSTYDEYLSDLLSRDENDSTRDFAPLAVADDAIYVETGNMTAREVARYLYFDIKKQGLAAGC